MNPESITLFVRTVNIYVNKNIKAEKVKPPFISRVYFDWWVSFSYQVKVESVLFFLFFFPPTTLHGGRQPAAVTPASDEQLGGSDLRSSPRTICAAGAGGGAHVVRAHTGTWTGFNPDLLRRCAWKSHGDVGTCWNTGGRWVWQV